MASITKRGSTYRFRVSCGYDGAGKQIVKTMTWKPAPEMTAKQAEKEAQKQAILFEEKCAGLAWSGSIKFKDFSDVWFQEYAERKLRKSTLDRLKGQRERVNAALGHLRMDKITARQVQLYINALGSEGANQKTGTALSAKTIKNHLFYISGIMDYAVKMGVISQNPCSRVVLPEQKKKSKEIYTLEETQRFIELLEEAPLKYKAFFLLAIYGGFRRGELMGLEWKDIDNTNCMVSIKRSSLYSATDGVYTDTTKTENSQRVIKIPGAVISVLQELKKEQTLHRLALGDVWEEHGRLFVTWNGRPMNPNTPYTWLQRFCSKQGIPFYGIHQFRHLNASMLINNGCDIKTVSALLGHSQASTTLNIYAHSFEEAKIRASEALETVLHFENEKKNA